MAHIIITGFKDELGKFFTDLNLAWLTKYFVVEPIDQQMLSKPREYIINNGGHIFFAMAGDTVAGTFALIKITDSVFELSKMAVDEAFHGNNIGNMLITFCLEEARRLKIAKLILYSNTLLQPAIHLYKKYGFTEVPLDRSDYARANIKMEILLNKNNYEQDTEAVFRKEK